MESEEVGVGEVRTRQEDIRCYHRNIFSFKEKNLFTFCHIKVETVLTFHHLTLKCVVFYSSSSRPVDICRE